MTLSRLLKLEFMLCYCREAVKKKANRGAFGRRGRGGGGGGGGGRHDKIACPIHHGPAGKRCLIINKFMIRAVNIGREKEKEREREKERKRERHRETQRE